MRRTLSLLALLLLSSILLMPTASTADDWNRLTTAIFHTPVQIPGQVLPAGMYHFKLADISGERNVVQIWDVDDKVLIASVLGFPEYMNSDPSDDLFIFESQGKDKPPLLISWFHRGNRNGERFIYPKAPARK